MLNLGIPVRRSPLVRSISPQLEIPLPVQPGTDWRISVEIHAMIVELRHRGFTVYREGHGHRIDGTRMATRQLVRILR